ncbi:MAG: Smr/MutS family protein, partial [Gemmatimonadota bacterium]|nr:Smr/MutS family protein [Gemmatimonadota bacterium]
VLEFPRVLDLVAERAASAPGAARVRELRPSTDRAWLDAEHARVAAIRALRAEQPPWHPEPIPELTAALNRLRVAGSRWTGEELRGGAQLLRSSRLTREALTDPKRAAVARAVLEPIVTRLASQRMVEDAIARTFDDEGAVRDDASPELKRIRRELRKAEGELVRILERAMAALPAHLRPVDLSITVRNGRYVIPVRREGRGAVGGIVHDASASGGTLFVEPPAAIEFGNRMRELEAAEHEEVERILAELTERLRPLRDQMLAALDALTELDSLYARARFADDFECAGSTLGAPEDGFEIVRGRHPLLVAQGIPVVPFDLAMQPAEHTLLVSGPNTGGKTVLLKALGLISALAQSGIPAPVGPASRIAVVDDFFADVGDEQSIEASLSTFSAHLKNLAEIVRGATARSLVLIDELGSGTDPLEGAALGWAILETLTRRGTTTVATTHLGTLKELAAREPGVVNASLQFDAAALAPTYRLVKGVPGRSYGISIARRLEMPEAIVVRAEERIPQHERDTSELLERLEKQERDLAGREAELEAVLDDGRRRLVEVARREHAVEERERAAERAARQEARRYLLDARHDIERTIRRLKEAGAGAIEDAGREARQAAERLAAEQAEGLAALDAAEARAAAEPRGPAAPAALAPGVRVAVATLGDKPGRIVDVRGGDAVVALGSLKVTVPLAALTPLAEPRPEQVAVAWSGDLPEANAPSEIDLRGMRADEAEGVVMQAIDSAVRADLRSLRIIHGKGTGALRERVAEMLKKDARVKAFRLGAWNEGGAGVTVADLA